MNKVPIIAICETCNKEFYRPLYKENKTCSKECRNKYFSFLRIQSGFKPPSYAAELSRKVVASTEYKNKRKQFYKDHPEIVKKMVENIKSRLIDGKVERSLVEKQQASMIKYRSSKEFKKHMVDINKIAVFEKMKQSRFQKGPQNFYGKKFAFRSPSGVIYKGKNLRDFIRNNHKLFDEWDVIWKKGRITLFESCRALGGLTALKPSVKRKRVNGSWKGWTWYSEEEKFYNEGKDLLNRNPENAAGLLPS